ncbi:hypothetical protein M413DRAFT_10860 [Hebeloma cylindrosporum]|uniref:Uncharacterized protein n=1 Tax=Hebeloma cylindrosporum TaxID=76867 RepID=A0A0C3CCU8_HEBCY|nr:hypothetical protein M413DRAFT_10860 [Hebeloma cylindrosporum h7]
MFTTSLLHDIVDRPPPMKSPIYNVPNDLLLKIFSVNTMINTEDDSMMYAGHTTPITTTRFSSQVCKHWRDLILCCPTLWGPNLNLNDLTLSRSDNWAKEVLSRTKEALLDVRVHFTEIRRSQAMTSFFFKVLDEEWRRIQYLKVTLSDRPTEYDDHRWLSICRPTENLRSIFLHLPGNGAAAPKPLLSTHVLFSGQAPSLRSVNIRHMNFQLSAAPWLSQLRELRLAGVFAPDKILASLSAMPYLEKLEISNSPGIHIPSWNPHHQWPKIILPHLRCLITRGPLEGSLMLLDHITPSPGCGLDFGSHTSGTEEEVSAASAILSRYIKDYLKTFNPYLVELLLSQSNFAFHTPGQPDVPPFDIRIEKSGTFSNMSFLFDAFLDCPLSGISGFKFGVTDGLTFPPSDPKFSKFISQLSSVRHMVIKQSNLGYLNLWIPAESGAACFPSLEDVTLIGIGVYAQSAEQVAAFLIWLKSVGGSIQSLDIGYKSDLKGRGVDLSSLEQFSGLRVHWSYPDESYICGSGAPERLNFVG